MWNHDKPPKHAGPKSWSTIKLDRDERRSSNLLVGDERSI